jgi:hypothetical protein
MVDTFDLDRASLKPIRRGAGGAAAIAMRYTDAKLSGEIRAPGRTIPIDVDLDEPVVAGGAGRDAVIAGLPLAVGYRATIRTFDLNMGRVRPMLLEVTGTEAVECAAGSFDTFIVTLTPLDDVEGGGATLKVMTAAPHTIVRSETKLPAAAGGGMARMELTALESGGSE